jgi:hypothetical protein
MLSRSQNADIPQSGWQFSVHESGNSLLSFSQTTPDQQPKQTRPSQVPIPLEAEISAELIRGAIDLLKQMPEDCVDWKSGFIDMQKGGTVIKDKRNGARCMVVQVIESGKTMLIFGVHEDSPSFRDSAFYRTVAQLTLPYLCTDSTST